MRYDPIHVIDCRCTRCASPADRTLSDHPDLAALRKGAIAGAWAVGLIASAKFGPSILDWLAS